MTMKRFFSALVFILFSFCINADASANSVVWRSTGSGRHGVEGLRFGSVITSLIREGNRVDVSSNAEYTLSLNGNEYKIFEGKQSFEIQ